MENYKSIDFSPWGGIDGFLQATSQGPVKRAAFLKSVVPWLMKANMMISNYVAGMPFEVVNDSGEVVDTSTDWTNAVGGMDNPRRLIGLLAGSLCGGSAYLIPEYTSKLIVNLQYVAPHTIIPEVNSSGVIGFERDMGDGKKERLSPDDLVYFWLPDSDVEIGPPLTSPMSASLLAAELLASMSTTMKTYADRGFVPAYIGNAKGMTSPEERKKAENYLTQFLKGAYKTVVKIFNSETFGLERVGAGMEELKGGYIEIQQAAIEDIGTAHGIPAALFMSDKAFASEVNPLLKTMYESSVFVSIYQTIEEVFNSQILYRYGKRLQFKPESLSVFQEDEASRSAAVSAYTSAIASNPQVAAFVMGFMGVDLDESQEHELEEIIRGVDEKAEDTTETPTEDYSPEIPEESPALSPDEMKDISLWYSKAKSWFLRGKGSAVDWENKHLREEIAAPIRAKLAEAKSELEIMRAFEIGEVKAESEIVLLANALNKAAEALGAKPAE